MSEHTTISWTDATFNCWQGCTAVSPGCDNCYAETLDKRWGGNHWGKGAPRKIMSDTYWRGPLKWQKSAMAEGKIVKVFCGSMCDVMDEEAPEGQWDRLVEVINEAPNLLWQFLTKRPHRYRKVLPVGGFTYDNVILGCTAEAQPQYDSRIDELVLASAWLSNVHGSMRPRVRTFVSYEPAIGPITMKHTYSPDWLIFGGETGNHPRPMEQNWAENIKAECEERGVAFFMKQMSARTPNDAADLIPTHLLVRQFPEVI